MDCDEAAPHHPKRAVHARRAARGARSRVLGAAIFAMVAGCSDALGPNEPSIAPPAFTLADADAMRLLVDGEAERIVPAIAASDLRAKLHDQTVRISRAIAANIRADIESELSAFYTLVDAHRAAVSTDAGGAAELTALTLVVDHVRDALVPLGGSF